MDCNEARPLLGAAVDRELSAAEALRVEQHLATCTECRREAQALQAVSQAVRNAAYFRASDALHERILAALPAVDTAAEQQQHAAEATSTQPPTAASRFSPAPAQDSTPPSPAHPYPPPHPREERGLRGRFDWRGAWAAWRKPRGEPSGTATGPGPGMALGWSMSVVVAVAMAVGITLFATRPAKTSHEFVDELVASHVRAQLSGHDVDVVSSDQHTVKPWFNGRLDYAPPVEDLADEGFALAGGRLDYIGHRRVGVLVYRYRKHVIDVYVMPDTGNGTATQSAAATLTSDGYALASWRGQGMRWWAVSDAEPAVLAQLHAALAARLSRTPPGPIE